MNQSSLMLQQRNSVSNKPKNFHSTKCSRMSAIKLIFVCVAFLVFATAITVTGEPCEDKPSWAKECVNLKRNFGERICTSTYYHMNRIARKKCRRTCGLCPKGVPAQPLMCSISRHGCCWDRVTAATGPRDRGCPPCLDRHRSLCRSFRWMCAGTTPKSDYIKFHCPIRCGFCNPNTYIATGKEESLQSILARMTWKEYRARKSRRG